MYSHDGVHDLVQDLEKSGSVLPAEGSRSSGHDPLISQVSEKIPRGKDVADVVLGERATGVTDHCGALLEAFRSQRYVSRDDDVILLNLPDDPGICSILSTVDYYELEPACFRGSHPGIRDQNHIQPIPSGNAIDLLFYRAGVCIYVDLQHGEYPFSDVRK